MELLDLLVSQHWSNAILKFRKGIFIERLISAILCLSMTLTMAVPAFAAQPTPALQSTTREGIIGDIFYEETTPSLTRSTEAVNTILSGTVNDDGTVSTYQYENNELIEYHTTVPGSGVVVSTYKNEDGTITTKETVVKENATANTKVWQTLLASGQIQLLPFSH